MLMMLTSRAGSVDQAGGRGHFFLDQFSSVDRWEGGKDEWRTWCVSLLVDKDYVDMPAEVNPFSKGRMRL